MFVFRGILLCEAVNYRGSARDLRFLQLRILFPYRVSRGNARLRAHTSGVCACVREPCDAH